MEIMTKYRVSGLPVTQARDCRHPDQPRLRFEKNLDQAVSNVMTKKSGHRAGGHDARRSRAYSAKTPD